MENCLEERLLQEFGPNAENTELRVRVFRFIEKVILSAFPSVRVAGYGSFPLKTFLRTGDIDITIIPETIPFMDMQNCMLARLKDEFEKFSSEDSEMNILEISTINAQVPLLKLKINSISADISVSQLQGIHTVCLFEELSSHFPSNLLKRSIILIKIWASHFGRIQGATYGGFSTYALEILVLFILNTHQRLTTPISVLKTFISFFGTFDWTQNVITVHKILSLSEYVSIISHKTKYTMAQTHIPIQYYSNLVCRLGGNPDLTLMQLKSANIVDPLNPSNNLARNVSQFSLERIKQVFVISAEILENKGIFSLFPNTSTEPYSQIIIENARILPPPFSVKKENQQGKLNNQEIFKGSYKKRQENFRRNFRVLLENTEKGRIKVK